MATPTPMAGGAAAAVADADAADDSPHGLSQYPTWKKTCCVRSAVLRMSVREKRRIFAMMRENPEYNEDSLLVEFGITLGDFCLMHILSDQRTAEARE